MLTQRRVGVDEQNALLFQVLADLVVDDLGFVLCGDTADQALLLGLGDAEAVVGVLDVLGQLIPRRGLLLGRLHEVLDVVEVDPAQVTTPGGHGLLAEQLEPFHPQVQHPLRLGLAPGDVGDDFLAQAALGRSTSSVAVRPAVLVGAQVFESRVALFDIGTHRTGLSSVIMSVDVVCVVVV